MKKVLIKKNLCKVYQSKFLSSWPFFQYTKQISFETMNFNLLFCAFEFLVLTLPPTPVLRISFSPRRASSKSSVVFKRAKESCLSLTSVFSCLKSNNTYLHFFSLENNHYYKSKTAYIYVIVYAWSFTTAAHVLF